MRETQKKIEGRVADVPIDSNAARSRSQHQNGFTVDPSFLVTTHGLGRRSMEALLAESTEYVAHQLRHHSESVIQAGLTIELQGRGATVQTEVPVPVAFQLSWSGATVTVGHVRLDCVVTHAGQTAAIEVKRLSARSSDSQLQKYITSIDPSWGLALVSPNGVHWVRHPAVGVQP